MKENTIPFGDLYALWVTFCVKGWEQMTKAGLRGRMECLFILSYFTRSRDLGWNAE